MVYSLQFIVCSYSLLRFTIQVKLRTEQNLEVSDTRDDE
jgi:hypothetical protein